MLTLCLRVVQDFVLHLLLPNVFLLSHSNFYLSLLTAPEKCFQTIPSTATISFEKFRILSVLFAQLLNLKVKRFCVIGTSKWKKSCTVPYNFVLILFFMLNLVLCFFSDVWICWRPFFEVPYLILSGTRSATWSGEIFVVNHIVSRLSKLYLWKNTLTQKISRPMLYVLNICSRSIISIIATQMTCFFSWLFSELYLLMNTPIIFCIFLIAKNQSSELARRNGTWNCERVFSLPWRSDLVCILVSLYSLSASILFTLKDVETVETF